MNPKNIVSKFLLRDASDKRHRSWEEILSSFPEEFQKEILAERTGTPEDIQDVSSYKLKNQEPVEISVKEQMRMPLTYETLSHLPEEVIAIINSKYGTDIKPGKIYDANPDRYLRYAKLPVATAKPSTRVDGEMFWGVGRFVAALLRGDKTIKVWDITTQ